MDTMSVTDKIAAGDREDLLEKLFGAIEDSLHEVCFLITPSTHVDNAHSDCVSSFQCRQVSREDL